jgi:hypothetical protein
MTSDMLFFAAAVLLIIGIGIYGAGLRKASRESQSSGLPSGVVVRSTPVLTEAEVVLYNLLRLAVQDHYLIFAQVPLLSFVSVEFTGQARVQVLNQMVQIDDGFTTASQTERQRVIQLAVEAAGIKLVTLQAQKSPGVADLVAILGLAGDE